VTYLVDGEDRVVSWPGLPPPDVGAPEPVVVSDESSILLAYRTAEELFVVVQFPDFAAYLFGEPNDEAISGHPLADRGLEPYGCYVVEDSSWIRSLERQNSVHPRHDPKRYRQFRHFVVAFHDSMFECIATAAQVTEERREEVWHRLRGVLRGGVA
jgi:hypothetical protein